MSVIAAALKHMLAAGMDPDSIVAAVADMETAAAPAEDNRTARQRRNARYYAAKASEKHLKASEQDVSDGERPSPKKEMSPAPLKEKTTPSQSETKVSSKKRATRLPADWTLPTDWRQDAINAGLPSQRIELEANKMLDWSRSAPGGAKLDWRASWRNWARQAADRLPRGSPGSRLERPDHFANFTRELQDGQDRDNRSDGRDWDDAQGVPILTIDHHRG